jgi:hypothetical protein
MKHLLFGIIIVLFSENLSAQGCCSGGSGSPIAGGASQGVLSAGQMEAASNFQYINSNKFKAGDRDTLSLFDNYNSKYLYSKIAYGITKDFTFSVEGGYFFNKTQIGKDRIDTITSSGIADLILFPRYDVYYRSTEKKKVEITLGLGYKIPLGKHDDSTLVYTNPVTGQQIFTTSPPLVQPTNGSQDIILYGFFLRGFPQHNFRIFANTVYIKKGWNSLGQKFGDYKSIGLFAGKTFFKSLGITLQVKGEMVDLMEYDKNIDMLALYNIDVKATGNKKIMFVPQVSYNYKSFTVYALAEIPLYEYVNGAQVITQRQLTAGISYRFFIKKPVCEIPEGEYTYICPMKCEGSPSNAPGKCKICGMELIKK